jgi:hypothetical protein
LQANGPGPLGDPLRPLKLMTVFNLVLLSLQAWTGDVMVIFAAFPQGALNTFADAYQALQSVGWPAPLAIVHAVGGILILLLALGIVVVAFRRTKSRSVRVTSLLGLIAVLSAVVGGYLFVFSGFLANGNSAQMGGSFIGAYAANFLVLYFSKS